MRLGGAQGYWQQRDKHNREQMRAELSKKSSDRAEQRMFRLSQGIDVVQVVKYVRWVYSRDADSLRIGSSYG